MDGGTTSELLWFDTAFPSLHTILPGPSKEMSHSILPKSPVNATTLLTNACPVRRALAQEPQALPTGSFPLQYDSNPSNTFTDSLEQRLEKDLLDSKRLFRGTRSRRTPMLCVHSLLPVLTFSCLCSPWVYVTVSSCAETYIETALREEIKRLREQLAALSRWRETCTCQRNRDQGQGY